MIKVGLIGYGKAGKAVARVLTEYPRFRLCGIARLASAPTGTDATFSRRSVRREVCNYGEQQAAYA
jgi:glyceraldehyde-3-phosphate dehydrogenase/erythrose-4-phosphate dehydrogenase